MTKTETIHPEFEELKGISPFWDNEREILEFEKTKYRTLQKFITDNRIDVKIDNLCYIVCLLEQEKQGIKSHEQLKDHKKRIQNDRLEVSDFLKKWEQDQGLFINTIKFDYGHNKFDIEAENFIFIKDGFFNIQHPYIIEKVLRIIWKEYKCQSSTKCNFKQDLKYSEKINSKPFRCKSLAKNLNRYLINSTTLTINRRYFVIGYLFQFVGIETELSIDRFKEIKNNSYYTHYKNYPDFVTKNIRVKYFKGVTKQQKKL